MYSFQQTLCCVSASIGLLLAPSAMAQEIPKEGPVDFFVTTTGEATMLAASQGTMQLNYEVIGMRDTLESGVNGVASLHCVGAASVFDGKFDNESGLCLTTYPDGSTTMIRYGGAGILGSTAEGKWSFIGGTGTLAGISGGGDYSRISGPNPSENSFASRNTVTGNYKLP